MTLGGDDAHISVERHFDYRGMEEEEGIENLLDFEDETMVRTRPCHFFTPCINPRKSLPTGALSLSSKGSSPQHLCTFCNAS